MKNIILLGSTGSVGRNVLDVVRHHSDKFRIKAISGNSNTDLLIEQAKEFSPDIVAVNNEDAYALLKKNVPSGTEVLAGPESIEELAGERQADIIFMAISGTAALNPLIAALKAGRTVALASKEPVVSAGMLINRIMSENNSRIIPVDSEHSAIMQCLSGRDISDVRTLYLTGSGGALKNTRAEDFDSLTKAQVLDHPMWDMGDKITVDSSTLMNKGLEVIEARWLFNVPPEKIKVVIHPEAIIHSMVEFNDGTISASMFCPDMRFPIVRALAFPDIIETDLPRVDFPGLGTFTFSDPDTDKFPALELAFHALRAGGTMPAVLNSSNEAAVKLFLDDKIGFTDIIKIVTGVVERHKKIDDPDLEDIHSSEKWALEEVLQFC